jgi:hypothetical protein
MSPAESRSPQVFNFTPIQNRRGTRTIDFMEELLTTSQEIIRGNKPKK